MFFEPSAMLNDHWRNVYALWDLVHWLMTTSDTFTSCESHGHCVVVSYNTQWAIGDVPIAIEIMLEVAITPTYTAAIHTHFENSTMRFVTYIQLCILLLIWNKISCKCSAALFLWWTTLKIQKKKNINNNTSLSENNWLFNSVWYCTLRFAGNIVCYSTGTQPYRIHEAKCTR